MTRIGTAIAALAILLGLVPFTGAKADVFDIAPGTAWIKVQDGEVVQWSVIPAEMNPRTRLDLMSYVEHGKRTTYYLVRRACANGKIETQVVKPGNVLGVGIDCNDGMVPTSILRVILDRVDALPPDAAALLQPTKS